MMLYGKYFVWVVLSLVAAIATWRVGARIKRRRSPTYEQLLEEKRILHNSVMSWKYADGSLVPQHKRQKMFRDLAKISRRIRSLEHYRDSDNGVS